MPQPRLRRDLQRFRKAPGGVSGAGLSQLPGGHPPEPQAPDGAEPQQAGPASQHFNSQLLHHHHSEETIFWPALREAGAGARPWSVTSAGSTMVARGMTRTREVMTTFAAEPSAANFEQAKVAFADLMIAVETHFVHEEA